MLSGPKAAVMIVMKQHGRFLLGKRSHRKAKAPGYWCPISGHVEDGESEEEAVVREAWEELGVAVRPIRKVATTRTHDGSVLLHWWATEIVSGTPRPANEENSALGWFTAEELATLEPVFQEDIELLLGLS
jgi:8-oxo-dGTP pyrophosphatase MutT (NUDIX family)